MARLDKKDRGLFERPKGSGIWWIRYHDHNGQERREKVGRKSDAQALYQSRKDTARKIVLGLATDKDLKRTKAITLKAFIQTCIPELETKPSWKDLKRMAKMWCEKIGDLPLDQVSTKHAVARRTALLSKGKTSGTCNRETTFLKAILNRAVDQGILEKSPLENFKNLPERNTRTRIMRGDEKELLRREMASEDFEVIEVALDTGILRGRLLALAWAHVDLENGWIDVVNAKGGSSRQVPMTNRVREILAARYATKKGLWVFPNKTGTNHLDPHNWYSRVYKPALERAGVEDLTLHDMRRTFASRMAMKGKGGRVLSSILGHTSSKTTDRYAHLDPHASKEAISVLDDPAPSEGLRVVK